MNSKNKKIKLDNSKVDFIKPEWFRLPSHLLVDSPLQKLKRKMANRDNESNQVKKSYTESRKEAAELRNNILKFVKCDELVKDCSITPNDAECNLIRYYYYIHQGVDISNIAPLDKNCLDSILSRAPGRSRCRKDIIKGLINEINDDFLFANKKSVIDFTVLDYECQGVPIPEPKYTLDEINTRKDRFNKIKWKIGKNLFVIHPTIVKISHLWYLQYRNLRIINVAELNASDALDLNQFKDWLSSQIKTCKGIVTEKWIPSVFKIVVNATKKKLLVNIPSKKLSKFYETLCTLMTLQFQTLCLKTIFEYTEFICDVKKSPGFQVHVLYKNNKIIFNPSYGEFRDAILNVYSDLITSVSDIPRIETKLFVKNIEKYDSLFLKPSILPNIVEECRTRVEETLKNEWICPELKIQDFDQYVCLINGQSRIEVNKFLSDDQPFELFKLKVAYFHNLTDEIALSSSRVVTIGTFEIHREHFISILMNKSQVTKDRFLTKIDDTYQNACRCLNEEFEIIKETLLKSPANTAELVRMKEYCLNLGTKVFFQMEDRLRQTMSYILFCSDYVPLTSAQIKQNSITFLWYRRINSILEENRGIIKKKTKEFQELLVNRIENFEKSLEKYEKEVAEFQQYRDANELPKYLKKSQNLHKKLCMASDRIREFNEEEVAFGWICTVYPRRDEIVEKLSPYKKLYENCADYKNKYQVWTEAKVGTFQPIEIEKDVETFHDNIIELSKQFSSVPAPYALTNSIRQEVEQFQGYMPIVNTLGNPCLKERHWEKISEIVGFPIRVEDDLTLAKILDYGLDEYVSKFQVISDSATKENNLEMRFEQMITEWKDMKFKIVPYRDSGTFILTTADEIQVLLDDHIVKTQTMKNSPYIKPFESTIHSWEQKLILLQEIIDTWFLVQKMWLYLEPIFTFSDIQQQMPEESKRFGAIDKIWKDIMKAASSNTTVLVVIGIDKMLERLTKCNTLLNLIRKGLGNYLDTKRLNFPRFFFLSNEEILDIISNTRDPSGVQPYLKKCFQGIRKFRFNDDCDILSIISDLGEELVLREIVNTSSRRGNVEKWLADVEIVMKESVREEISKTVDSYDRISYEDLMKSSIQQVVCLVVNIMDTRNVEKIIPSTKDLETYLSQCLKTIGKWSEQMKIKTETKNRLLMECLFVLSIQIRDSVRSLIDQINIDERIAEYDMQLRYYFEKDEVSLKMANSSIAYGNEYIGDIGPMIRTPTTDRCLRSFFIAFKYNLGAYLEAPVGLGKSTLIQNFARLAAKHFIMFGCFGQLDYSVVEKFFKGVVASDSWFCFDNLHMLNKEGLQIVDHFVMAIQRCVLFDEECVRFNGTSFKSCNGMIFATVCKEKYPKKSVLPACVRTYFRRICFNEIEHTEIIEIELAILGFRECTKLAKMVSGVLSSCDDLFKDKNYFHYDIRLIKNILENVKFLKSKHTRLDEKIILARAIRLTTLSVLRPKDIRLLETILKNVFQEEIRNDRSNELTNLIRKICLENKLVYNSDLDEKIELFYTAMKYNSGLVLVGEAFTGKTTILKILSEVYSNKMGITNAKIEKVVINPQSVTLQQLYGHQNPNTREWVDGILSSHYRKFSKSDTTNRKWLVFDGPCNPSWMEQLHSVLDETGKLFLKSGESLELRDDMNLIFECDHLHHVSPSVISRCCLVFTNENTLKWQYLISSWVKNFPPFLNNLKEHVEKLASRFCPVLFSFIDSVQDNLIYPVTKNIMIKSLCDIFDCFVDDFNDENYIQNISEIDTRSQLEGVFFFSCIWSLGALLNKSDREQFDLLFRALQQKEFPEEIRLRFNLSKDLCGPAAKQYVYIIPDYGTIFDYQYIKEGKGKWKLWSESVTLTSAIPRDVQFHQIIVPTKATIRNHNLTSMLISHRKAVLFVGDAATGKSVDIKYYLNNELDKSTYKPIFLNFSTSTTGNAIQRSINHHLDKRKKGVFGPPLGMRYVLFIDDINTSTSNKYGVFSAIELLRHCIEYDQWYNTETASAVQLVDLQLICSFTTKHDGDRYSSYARFCRHFNFISNDVFDDETLKSIFSKIMLWHLDTRGFSKEFDPCIDQIVNATLAIHRLVQKNLLPLPHKSHYIFNLRDFSRIVQGVVLSVPEAIEDLSAMKRLWVHEVMRIYHDKITNLEDSNWFMGNLKSVIGEELKENTNELLSHLLQEDESDVNQSVLTRLIFCDFINPKADVRNYAEVQDMEGLQSIVEGYLVEHNNVNKKPMNLILFPYAIEHISRICRILKQPQGHALLLGNCGLGKQSLARLAIHMCEYEFFEVELTSRYNELDWKKDMKSLLCSVYTDQHSAFLLNNIQVMPESMLEDVSNLLQTGEIPEIFAPEDMKEIYEKMEIIDNQRDKSLQTDGSHEALYNLFHQRVRKQIHIVLVFNASIHELRKYIHKFPPFNNCCTIDWFQSWPENALKIVSEKLLSDVKLDTTDFKTVTKLCEKLHNSTTSVALEADNEMNIKLYFTQKSYIKLVATFKHLLTKKQTDLQNKVKLLEKSMQRLSSIKEQIPFLERECETLQPTIHDKKILVEKLENEVEAEKELETEAEISTNGAKTKLKNCEKKLNSKKQEFDLQLAQVQEIWENVCENLRSLSTSDINLLKTMKNPPKPLKALVEALAIIKEIKPEKIQESGKIVEDFWRPTIKYIGDAKFIDGLINFDKSEVSTRNIRIFEEKILSNEDFDGDKIRSCSVAAEATYKWIMVVYEYAQVTKMDSDVKLNLNEAEEEYAAAESNFKTEEKHLEDVRKKRDNLIEALDKEKTELESLEKKENLCFKKKLRAEEFVKILSRKKSHWIEKKAAIDETFDTLIGDVLLCACSLTYLTALPCQFRDMKVKAWYETIREAGIKCKDDFKLWSILMDGIDVLKEHIVGLPEDDFYRDNLAMIRCSGRYPILIDPHRIMTKWIKTSNKNLVVIQPECVDYLQRLETAIASDHPVLLENIGQYLDTILYPLLEQRYFKTSAGSFIKLGEASIEYKPDLELYLSTFLENPHFTAEIYDKVSIVNCSMPQCASEGMLLKQIMMRDRADLHVEQNQQTVQLLDLKKAAVEAEMKILTVLSTDGDILDSDDELNAVTISSMVIDDNLKKISEIESRLEAIQCTENEYDSNIKHFSNLFQISMSLRNLCDIYQFSFEWLGNLIGSTVERIEKTGKPEQRCETISESVLKNFFSVTSYALEEVDKLIFAFLLAANSMLMKGILETQQIEMFYGMLKSAQPLEYLKNMKFFETSQTFEQNKLQWIETIKQGHFPETWTQLNNFQKVILAQNLCPENAVHIITKFVEIELGKEYSDFGSFDLGSVFKDSNSSIPIALVLFDDLEPLQCVFNFAVHMGIGAEKCHVITLTKTSNAIQADLEPAMSSGDWLILRNLQNCPNWLHDFEKICEDLPSSSAHPDFRLWLILQHDLFCPTKILERSQLVAYGVEKYINVESFKKELTIRLKPLERDITLLNTDLVPNLIAFHQVVLETFMISSWNGYYEFTDTDLLIACQEITEIITRYENIPSNGLVKFIRECCYANQIGDRWDSEYIVTLIKSFWNDEIITDVKTGKCIESGLIHSKNLPAMDISRIYEFGNELLALKLELDAKKLVYKLLKLRVDNMKDKPANDNTLNKIKEIIDLIPEPLNDESNSMQSSKDVVRNYIADEVDHFNKIIRQVTVNLSKLRNALLGHLYLNDDLEMLWNALKSGSMIPSSCLLSFSTKIDMVPVEPFVKDIRARGTFLEQWLKQGAPDKIDFSFLEYPRTFLICILLQHGLNVGQPITDLQFDTEIDGSFSISNAICITGLHIENASWDRVNKTINLEAFQSVHELPEIRFTSSQKHDDDYKPKAETQTRKQYHCPAYKVNTYDNNDRVVITTVTIPIESTSNIEYLTKRRIKIVTKTTR